MARIVINGRWVEETRPVLSYEEVVMLAEMSGSPSMTWTARDHGGCLSPGRNVAVKAGMVLNVIHTGRA